MPLPVLLVNPRACKPKNARLPLSILTLGAALDGKAPYRLVDGNLDAEAGAAILAALDESPHALVGMTVMPGPQVGPAIELSKAVKARHPEVPVVWGGYFPTLYPAAAINAPYVDVVVRGPGEETLPELAAVLPAAGPPTPLASAADASALRGVAGITWKDAGAAVHNAERAFRPPDGLPPLPFHRLGDPARWLRPTALGRRTGVHQAAVGCRYRCSFCGVVSMFDGRTLLSSAGRVAAAVRRLRDELGADSVQFYDNNFFDREESSVPVLEALAPLGLPWWCYARPDTLAGFSARTWDLLRRSGLKMAYVGAEAASDEALRRMHKGATVDETLEVARRCREHGIVPEFSFVLGGPEDPEGDVETTLAFIRTLKAIHPECEVILYFHTPTPRRSPEALREKTPLSLPPLHSAGAAPSLDLPGTPEEWTEKRWVDFVCHQDAPWLTLKLRRRVKDFAEVLACRFPTAQDVAVPRAGKALLSALASWRWATRTYARPVELRLARKLIPLREPQAEGL
ncbi:MAG TPA: radical SAM protein [Thermoanaerobaculia bacterium]|nr:radical SAM protein [Thermoanaerobaculia bacterium]HQR67185.1 radical SAM protein [Thermoanaerobaculia bacterium]